MPLCLSHILTLVLSCCPFHFLFAFVSSMKQYRSRACLSDPDDICLDYHELQFEFHIRIVHRWWTSECQSVCMMTQLHHANKEVVVVFLSIAVNHYYRGKWKRKNRLNKSVHYTIFLAQCPTAYVMLNVEWMLRDSFCWLWSIYSLMKKRQEWFMLSDWMETRYCLCARSRSAWFETIKLDCQSDWLLMDTVHVAGEEYQVCVLGVIFFEWDDDRAGVQIRSDSLYRGDRMMSIFDCSIIDVGWRLENRQTWHRTGAISTMSIRIRRVIDNDAWPFQSNGKWNRQPRVFFRVQWGTSWLLMILFSVRSLKRRRPGRRKDRIWPQTEGRLAFILSFSRYFRRYFRRDECVQTRRSRSLTNLSPRRCWHCVSVVCRNKSTGRNDTAERDEWSIETWKYSSRVDRFHRYRRNNGHRNRFDQNWKNANWSTMYWYCRSDNLIPLRHLAPRISVPVEWASGFARRDESSSTRSVVDWRSYTRRSLRRQVEDRRFPDSRTTRSLSWNNTRRSNVDRRERLARRRSTEEMSTYFDRISARWHDGCPDQSRDT